MALIKNDVVSMDWEADKFYETKKGFVAAVKEYSTENGVVPVIFQDNIAYLLVNENGSVFSTDECAKAIKDIHKNGGEPEDLYEENYIELGRTAVVGDGEDAAHYNGLSDEDIADINNRLDDLSGYWTIFEEKIGG